MGGVVNNNDRLNPISCFKLVLKWNEATEQWRLLDKEGNTIQEMFDCKTINNIFKPEKGKDNKYQMLVRKIN